MRRRRGGEEEEEEEAAAGSAIGSLASWQLQQLQRERRDPHDPHLVGYLSQMYLSSSFSALPPDVRFEQLFEVVSHALSRLVDGDTVGAAGPRYV